MLPTMSLFFLSLLIIVAVDVVHGGGTGVRDCRETRCTIHGPAIRFPFRLKERQPVHCGYPGFELSCTADGILLEMSSSSKLFVKEIDYMSQLIVVDYAAACLPGDIFNSSSASPFRFFGNASLFSCPPSTVRDDYSCLSDGFLKICPRYSNRGNHFYATLFFSSIDGLPIVSCTKVLHYAAPAYTSNYGLLADFMPAGFNKLNVYWSIPSCQHCEKMGKLCSLKNGFANKTDPQTQCLNVSKAKGVKLGAPTLKILGSCMLSVCLLVTGATIYYVYSSVKREEENQLRIRRFLDEYRALKPSRYSYADIKRMTEQFKEKLGQGAYGSVFKGRLSTELLVAVKILNNSNEKGEDFINEVGTMGQIHHVNVVRLVGYCADGFIRALVYEFLPNGPLQNFLSSADNENLFLGWEKLQDIALGIAKGIEYLHQGCEQQILHFDIKPHNVLLDHDFTPKVSDFGLAKLCSKDQSAVSMTAARGTVGYIAPEVYSRNFGNVSYKADVYSFGTLLLEMVEGRKNFKVMEDSSSQVYFPEWIYNLLEQGNDLRIHVGDEGNVDIARKLAIVGLWCIQWHPIDRPSMKTVVQMLEREGDNLTMPPNPFVSTSSS